MFENGAGHILEDGWVGLDRFGETQSQLLSRQELLQAHQVSSCGC